jgi:HEAT repeat protein
MKQRRLILPRHGRIVRVIGYVAAIPLAAWLLFGTAAPARVAIAGALIAPDTALLQRMLVAEDARATEPASLAALIEGLQNPDADTRRLAVRGLGRLERQEHLARVEPLMTDPSPAVRAEAVNAAGQIAKGVGPQHSRPGPMPRFG